eukprot:jgi/Botrbrau1/22752/Bobra.0132s0084.1
MALNRLYVNLHDGFPTHPCERLARYINKHHSTIPGQRLRKKSGTCWGPRSRDFDLERSRWLITGQHSMPDGN